MTRREMVRAFMVKHNIPRAIALPEQNGKILDASRMLMRVKDTLDTTDAHELRASLLIEELAEFLEGVATGDTLAAADGLADLAYVVEGASEVYNLPLGPLFDEVHRSNMTKAVSTTRVKDKGPDYQPPLIHRVLVKCFTTCDACDYKNRNDWCEACQRRATVCGL